MTQSKKQSENISWGESEDLFLIRIYFEEKQKNVEFHKKRILLMLNKEFGNNRTKNSIRHHIELLRNKGKFIYSPPHI